MENNNSDPVFFDSIVNDVIIFEILPLIEQESDIAVLKLVCKTWYRASKNYGKAFSLASTKWSLLAEKLANIFILFATEPYEASNNTRYVPAPDGIYVEFTAESGPFDTVEESLWRYAVAEDQLPVSHPNDLYNQIITAHVLNLGMPVKVFDFADDDNDLKRAVRAYDYACLDDPRTPIPECAIGLALATYFGGLNGAIRHFVATGTRNKIQLSVKQVNNDLLYDDDEFSFDSDESDYSE